MVRAAKEATAAYAESMAIYKQLVAEYPDRPEFRLGLAKSHSNLGGLIVGVVESLGALALPGSLKELVIYAVFLLVLLFRPEGLMTAAARR